MDSFGRAQKYASSRKQELLLQKELEAIRNKALFDRYSQLHPTEATSPSQPGREDVQPVYSPKPPSQPKPSSSSSSTRKRVRMNQPATKVEIPSTGGLQVSTGPVCKPITSKRVAKPNQKPPTAITAQADKKVSPQKVVVDTSTNVKFAITSSLNTSVPVKHAQRDKPKVATKDQSVSKKSRSETKYVGRAKRRTKTKVNDSKVEQLVSHTDYAQIDSSAANTMDTHTPRVDMGSGFSLGPPDTGGWSHTPHNDSVGEDSFQGSSVDMSFGSQDNFQTGFMDTGSPSELGLRPLGGEYQDTQPSTSNTSQMHTNTARVSHAPSGTLMLEIDMRFKSMKEQISEHSQLSLDSRDHDYSPSSSRHSLPSTQRLEAGTTAEQSAASLKDNVGNADDTKSQVNMKQSSWYLSQKSVASTQSLNVHSSDVLATPGMENPQTGPTYHQPRSSAGSIRSQDHGQPASSLSETDQDAHSNVSTTSIVAGDHTIVQGTDIVGVQSEVTVSELDQSAPTPVSAHSTPTLGSWGVDNLDSRPKTLHSGVDSNDGSSTVKASDDKGSMFSSVGGSLSSFGTPFSMQSQSHSPIDSHTPKYSPSLKTDSQSSVEREKPTYSKPNIDQYLLISSDQHIMATSSWLQTISGNVDFGSESDVSSIAERDDDNLDAHDVSLRDASGGFSSRSDVSSNIQGQSVLNLEEVSRLELGREDKDQAKSAIKLESHSIVVDPTLVEANPEQEDSNKGNLDSSGTISVHKEKQRIPSTIVGTDVEGTVTVGKIDLADGDISQGRLPEFLAYSEAPVTLEDILNITGQKLPRQQKLSESQQSPLAQSLGSTTLPERLHTSNDGTRDNIIKTKLTFLSTWESSTSNQHSMRTSIHHFCTASLLPQLPVPVQILSHQTHAKPLHSESEVPDMKQADSVGVSHQSDLSTIPPPNTPRSPTQADKAGNERRRVISKQKKKQTKPRPDSQLGLSVIAKTGNRVPEDERLVVTGAGMQVAKNPSNLLWTPAPPKLSLHPSTIQAHLFPQYKAIPTSTTDSPSVHGSFVLASQGQGDGTTNKDKELLWRRSRLLDPAFRSVPNFSSLLPQLTSQPIEHDGSPHVHSETKDSETASIVLLKQEDEQSVGSSIAPEEEEQAINKTHKSILSIPSQDLRRFSIGWYPANKQPDGSVTVKIAGNEAKAVGPTTESDSVRHTQSLPQLPSVGDGTSVEPSIASKEFDMLMKEVESQREQLVQYHKELRAPKEDKVHSTNDLSESDDVVLSESMLATSATITSRKLQRQIMKGTRRGASKGGGTAGRIRALRRTKSGLLRTERAKEVLSQPPRILKRRGSYPMLNDELIEITQQHIGKDHRPSHHSSLPFLTEERFSALMVSQGGNPKDDSHKWALDLWWDTWFPEVLKECREAVAELSSGRKTSTAIQRKAQPETSRRQSVPTDKSTPKELQGIDWKSMLLELEDLEPVSTQLMSSEMIKTYEGEVLSLNQTIAASQDSGILAIHYCRRGAVLRKLGRLKESLSDLNHALSLQPTLSDAYWHRHLLFLLKGNEKAALDDLTLLLKQNKKHFGALRSKASLLVKKGDLASAVYNMTLAIALQPNDPESYFVRAELYEKRGEVESALSDYARVSELDPTKLEAFGRPAMHKFKKGMWAASTHHFAALLLRDPNNTEARIYRARANYNLGRYMEALRDLSAAIHLDPNGAQAFYHRACLLRNSLPKQALRDFSVSLLLDDSAANVHTFVHRGVLYTQLKCYEEALLDFESAVRLQRTLPSPHVCAGLIHMLQRKNITRAIRCFSAGIFVDPTCTRAYLCRAEAYQREAKYKLAILDYTRAIHLEPNNPTYYLYKGELFLHLRELELASLHIRIAAKLSTGFDQNKTQRALVDSFLGNYQQAVTLLRGLPKTPEVYSLLGKIQFKARDFESAADSFEQAIYLAERATKPSHLVTHVNSRGEIDSNTQRKFVNKKTKTNFHFLNGKSLVESGSLKEAVNEFTKVIHSTPDHDLAYYERGVAKLMDGNSKGVLDLNKSLALNSKLFQSFLARAAHYGKTGRFSKAILNCNEAIRLEPASVRAYLCRGALKYHTKLYSGAVCDFSTAIRLDPRHASLGHFNRALCYQATGKLQMALSDFSTVFLLVDSPGFKVLVNRALLYLELGDWSNGLLDFIMAGKLVKDDPAIFQAIGYCYHRLGAIDSAIEAYTEAISLDPSFLGAYVGRGNAYMDYLTEEGNSKSKLDYLYTLELDSSYLPARVNLAFLLQAEGKFQEAWNELTVALQKDEWYVSAREARAVISLQMGNLFGALLDINAAIQVCKSALLLTNRGVIQQFMGDIVSAMNDYQEAVKVDPQYTLAHFNVGNILFQQRHFRQAVDSYTKALTGTDSDDSVFVNRAIAHVMLRDTGQALEDFNEAVRVNPYSAHAYFNRANLYRSLEEYSPAEQDYKQALDLQPEDWLTMYYYGEVLGKLNREDSAHEMLTIAAGTEIMSAP